jgi:hypothetical protein
MAIEFIEAVWQISPYKAEKLLVQLACADWSNADGEFWPTYSEIAKKARVSKPGAIGIIEQLLADGEFVLVEKGGGRGNVNRYKFGEDYMETVTTVRQTWAKIRERKGKRALPNVPQERVNEGDPFPGERVNQNDEKGKPELLHIRKNRHEPEEREREAADSLSELLCELHGIGDKAGWQLKDKFQSLAIVLAGLDATPAQVKEFWASRTKKPAINYFAGDFTTWRAGQHSTANTSQSKSTVAPADYAAFYSEK